MVVARSWGRGNRELLFNMYRVSVLPDEMFWRWMVVMFAQQWECASCHRTIYLKMVNLCYVHFTVTFTKELNDEIKVEEK